MCSNLKENILPWIQRLANESTHINLSQKVEKRDSLPYSPSSIKWTNSTKWLPVTTQSHKKRAIL
jgi:hypothetical protein